MTGTRIAVLLAAAAVVIATIASSTATAAATASFNYPSAACPLGATGLSDCVDTAGAGDTINVKPGLYYENVTVDESVTIKGKSCGKVLFDGATPAPPAVATKGVAFLVQADDVTIACLTIRNATDGVKIDGGDYDGLTVSSIRTRGVDEGVDATGASADDTTVKNSIFRGLDQNGADIDGANALVEGNHCVQGGDDCIEITGDNAVARKNSALNIDDGGIMDVNGDNFQVIGNTGTSLEDQGLQLRCDATCDNVRVQDNRVVGVSDDTDGIELNVDPVSPCAAFPCIVVTGNRADLVVENAFELFVDDALIVNNEALRAGESDGGQGNGFRIDGNRNLIQGNRAIANTIDGLRLTGDENVVRGNTFSENYLDGLQLTGSDNTVDRNTVKQNDGDGIENDGTGTILTGNMSKFNRYDCANGGTIAVNTGNTCGDGSNFAADGTID